MSTTVSDRTAHIARLAREHGVQVDWRNATRARAIRGLEGPSIRITWIRTDTGYLTALHELGHHLSRSWSKGLLEREAAAWDWAIAHVEGDEPTEAAWRSSAKALRDYLRQAQCRAHGGRRGAATIPAGDSRFWDVLERLEQLAGGIQRSPWSGPLERLGLTDLARP